MVKRQTEKVLGVIIILMVVGALAYNHFFLSVPGGELFINPDWAKLICKSTPAYEKSFTTTIDQTDLFRCSAFTEECRLKIKDNADSNCLSPFKPSGTYHICDLNGNNCAGDYSYNLCEGEETDWIFIDQGKSVSFDVGIFVSGEERTEVTFEWQPWMLYREVGGAEWVVNSANCDITSSTKANIPKEDYPGSQLYRQGGEGQRWVNYINAWNYAPPTNVFIHPTYGEVYCNAARIYSIVQLEMADGTLKKVNPTYSGDLPNGDTLNGMGTHLANVECCPNEPGCNDNFEYDGSADECFTDAQCFNAGGPIPISGTQYVVYKCQNNECVETGPFTVECTNNAFCPPEEICDLSTMNYGNCIEQTTDGYCGDGKCEALLGETQSTCPGDCGRPTECETCFDWLFSKFKHPTEQCESKTYYDREWYNPISWILPKGGITQDGICPLFLLFIVIVGLLVIMIVFMLIKIINKSNRRRK